MHYVLKLCTFLPFPTRTATTESAASETTPTTTASATTESSASESMTLLKSADSSDLAVSVFREEKVQNKASDADANRTVKTEENRTRYATYHSAEPPGFRGRQDAEYCPTKAKYENQYRSQCIREISFFFW